MMKPIKWHVGCSGFHYREWKGEFYPVDLPQKKWFEYYAEHFNTLELNVTFYRFPTLNMLSGWHEKAPDGFSFSTKVPRSITHYRKLEDDADRMLDDFYKLIEAGLKEKLACVLFQMPPQFSFTEERLELVIQSNRKGFKNVFEFRNESWWAEETQTILASEGVNVSGVSFPKISCDDANTNTELSYYRFHGVPRLFYSEYDESFIKRIYDEIIRAGNVEEAFVYFNNTASLAALHNARQLLSAIAQPLV